MRKRIYHTKRIWSLFTAIVMIITMFDIPVFSAEDGTAEYFNTLDEWSVQAVWSSNSSESLEYASTKDENINFTLTFSYFLNGANRDYNENEVKFIIKGIGDIQREGILQAITTTTQEDSDWTLNYDADKDEYTFIYKRAISQNQILSGGFQMQWSINSRKAVNGYTYSYSPVFSITDGSETKSINMPPVSLEYTSERDVYNIDLKREQLTGLEKEEVDEDYIWYDYVTIITKDWKARGIYKSDYFVKITIPDGMSYDDVIATDTDNNPIEIVQLEDPATGEMVYGFYRFQNRVGNLNGNNSNYTDTFRLGFKKDVFEGKDVTVDTRLIALYNDETEKVITSDKDKITDFETRTVLSYDFEYDSYNYSQYKTTTNNYNTNNRILVNNLYSGRTVLFTLTSEIYRKYGSSSSSASTSESDDTSNHPNRYETFDLIQGDDHISICQNNGQIRELEESEYNFKYVTIPNDKYKYDYEIYIAYHKNQAFSAYTKYETGNTSTSQTVHFPDGVKAIYVKFKNVSGSYVSIVYAAVNFKFDWNTEQGKPEAEQIDPDGYFSNFSYLRLVKADGVNFASPKSTSYQGSYGEILKARDYSVYGEYLYRSGTNAYIRSAATKIDSETVLDSFELLPTSEGGDGNYHSTVTSTGTIVSDESGELKKFSLYTVLSEGMLVNDSLEGITVTGTATGVSGQSIKQTSFENNVSYELRTDSSGRQIIVANFDFTDNPLESSKQTQVSISFPTYVTSATYAATTAPTYIAESYTMVHDDGIQKIIGSKLAADKNDLDGDGNKTEYTARSSASKTIGSNVIEWMDAAQKYVKSDSTNNVYVHGLESQNVSVNSFSNLSDADNSKSVYSYRLDLSVGDISIKDIILFDNIEPESKSVNISGKDISVESKWHGQLLNVDTSQVDKLGIISTVYYSENEYQVYDLSVSGWTEMTKNGSIWTAPDGADVRSIAVVYDTANVSDSGIEGTIKDRLVYTIVNMQAPEITNENGYKDDTTAQNNFHVAYKSLIAGEYQSRTLDSAVTNVTLNETKPVLTIKKYDAETKAALSGAKFTIYRDEDCTEEVEGLVDVEVNNLGIFTGELPELGTYYMKETQAPTGYKLSSDVITVEANTSYTLVEVYNERMTGTVNFKKKDADDESIDNLEGAEYQLYTLNGTQVFTDENNFYSTTGTKGTFVTDEDGFKITGLPWGNYYLVETKAPTGYDINNDKVSFSIMRNGTVVGNAITVALNQSDKEQTATLTLTKTDEMTGERLKNAWYRLEKKVGDEWVDAGFSNVTTNAYGELTVEEVKFGEYRFVEINAPNGYEISNTGTVPASVVLDATTVGRIIEFTQSDKRKTGSIDLTKYSDTGTPLANAKFDLYMVVGEKDGAADAAEDDPADQLIRNNLVTDTNGKIQTVEDLEWGKYYFVETYAPTGYRKDDAIFVPETVEITSDNVDIPQEVEVTDKQIPGSVKLTKYGENTDGSGTNVKLKDAVFVLCDKDGNKIKVSKNADGSFSYNKDSEITEMTTDENGEIAVNNLPWGVYYFKEIKAPSGYALADNVRFTVNANTCLSVQELECYNYLIQCQITIEKIIDDVLPQFGNPEFILKIKDDNGQEWTKTIQLSTEQKSGSITLSVAPGTYTIEEVQVSRYTLDNIEFVESDTTATFKSIEINSRTATVELQGEDSDGNPEKASVKFTNSLTNYDKFSHVTGVTNIVAAQKKITGISVEYIGDLIPVKNEETDNDYIIPKENLTAKIIYEDGSEEIIEDTDNLIPTDGNTDFTVNNSSNYASNEIELEAQYTTEDNKTFAAKFYVTIAPAVVTPTQKVIYRIDANNESYFNKDGKRVTANVVYYSDGEAVSGTYITPTVISEINAFYSWLDADGNLIAIDEDELKEYLKENSDKTEFTVYAKISLANMVKDFDYTGDVQEFTALVSGYYKLEVWGASGGDGYAKEYKTDASYGSHAGAGGYSYGTIYLEKGETVYVIVGGQGTYGNLPQLGGYNGGGGAYYSGGSGSGGGMTHISWEPNVVGTDTYSGGWVLADEWNSEGTIIVAGGGGGTDNYQFGETDDGSGGYGGGETGGGAKNNGTRVTATNTYGSGGTQTSGYKQGKGQSETWSNDAGGGGGGWYGGYGGSGNNMGGGGGSGYISSDDLIMAETIGGNNTFLDPQGNEETGHWGNGYARITYINPYSGVNFKYTGDVQTFTAQEAGIYLLEAWGASGGDTIHDTLNYVANGGKGGYSFATVSLEEGQTVYITVGGRGEDSKRSTNIHGAGDDNIIPGGYNGGGNAYSDCTDGTTIWSSGGGATSITTESGLLSDFESNKSAILTVAGGGGGSGIWVASSDYSVCYGGVGGGETGGTAIRKQGNTTYTGPATGGTQSSAGSGQAGTGAFGQGANANTIGGAGGGGGYYGGGAGYNWGAGGGGGSGYISSELTNSKTITGDNEFLAPNATKETGHTGDGYARITFIGSKTD